MFGALGRRPAATALTFVSQAALEAGVGAQLGLREDACRGARHAQQSARSDLIHNDYQPHIEVDSADLRGARRWRSCSPASRRQMLPLAQRYFLF